MSTGESLRALLLTFLIGGASLGACAAIVWYGLDKVVDSMRHDRDR